MPRKGYRQTEEHIALRRENMQETFMARGADQFFSFVLGLDKEDRDEVIAERAAKFDEILDGCERLLAKRRRIRNSAGDQQVERFRKELLRNVRELIALRGTGMYNAASTPYVSETQTRHVPMTGVHTHDHAAYGHDDHSDGLHLHEHTHNGDATHDHPHSFGSMAPGRVSQTGEVTGRSSMSISDYYDTKNG